MSGPHFLIATQLLSAANAVQEGQAAQRQAAFAARVAERDAAIARDRAALQARKTRRAGRADAARARVSLAGGGARLDGTPLDLLAQIAGDSELAALEDIYGGDIAAGSHLADARASRLRGRSARRGGLFRAGSSLLGAGRDISGLRS